MDRWMKNNNFNKILALALAMILWTIVHVDTAPTNQTTVSTESKIIENVKIEVTGFDEEKYVMETDAESVRMEVVGKKSDLTYKFSDAYKVWIDLSNVEPGDTTLPLNYSLPSGVRLVDITPNDVNVHVELRNTKSFPISVVTKGEPAAGYQVGTPILEPITEAQVTLAASELSNVAKVQGTIELNGEKENVIDKKMKLRAYDSSGNEIKNAVIEPSTVSVELPISLPFKSLPLDISFTGQLPSSLVLSRVTPEHETVNVYGNEETLAGLSSYEAVLDLSLVESAGTRQLELELKPPEGTEKVEPGKVNVTVSAAEIAERTLDNIPIKLEGVGGGLTALFTDPAAKAVTLTVSGAPTLLDQLDRDNISVVADVGGLARGVHQVTLQVSLPRFINLVNGLPLTATIELHSTATPTAPPAPDTDSAVTPEPSAEAVTGEEHDVTPSHGGDNAGSVSPLPSASPLETGEAPGVEGNGNNAASTGGT